MPHVQALDAAEEEEKSAEANFQLLSSKDAPPPPPDIGDNLTITPGEMTVAALQEALSKRGLDTKWNPLEVQEGACRPPPGSRPASQANIQKQRLIS